MPAPLHVALYGDSLLLACLEAALQSRAVHVSRAGGPSTTLSLPDLLVIDDDLLVTPAASALRERYPGVPVLALAHRE